MRNEHLTKFLCHVFPLLRANVESNVVALSEQEFAWHTPVWEMGQSSLAEHQACDSIYLPTLSQSDAENNFSVQIWHPAADIRSHRGSDVLQDLKKIISDKSLVPVQIKCVRAKYF